MSVLRKGIILRLFVLTPICWILLTLLVLYNDHLPQLSKENIELIFEPKPLKKRQVHNASNSNGSAAIPPLARKRNGSSIPILYSFRPKEILFNGPDGPGEMGKPVILKNLTADQEAAKKEGYKNNAFNQYASDMIALHRSLPDARTEGCKNEVYSPNLPQASVVVIFHNEAWSALLRTVHSIIDRSPAHLLREIVLVDDFSDMPHLKEPLEEYISNYAKVKLVRSNKRLGLIQARTLGGRNAAGPVLIYLDSHCECTVGWLEPLLDRIHRNSTTAVVPTIDVVNDDTMEYQYQRYGDFQVGGFSWHLLFTWHYIPKRDLKELKNKWDPVRSPTMAGGLFAIDKAWFEKLGWYDPEYDIWGAENLELSFKVWMCGGKLESIPCSHVGHIYRKSAPYKKPKNFNYFRRNTIRLAVVWLDEFAMLYYQSMGNKVEVDYGDVSERKALRKKLGCKSFRWYIDNVYPGEFSPDDVLYLGELRNRADNNICLDSMSTEVGHDVATYHCHGLGGNQFWVYTKQGEIRKGDDKCLDYPGGKFILHTCHGHGGNQNWLYDKMNFTVYHNVTQKCMEMKPDLRTLTLEPCNWSLRQQWVFQKFNVTPY